MPFRRPGLIPSLCAAAVLALSLACAHAAFAARSGRQPVRVASVEAYRERVESALSAARAAKGRISSPQRSADLAGEIRELLPKAAVVKTGEGQVSASDPQLDAILGRLEDADGSEARRELESLERHLVSLSDALGDRDTEVPSDPRALAALLEGRGKASEPELDNPLSEWLATLAERVFEWLGGLASSGGGGTSRFLTYGVMGVLALVLVVSLVMVVRGLRASLVGRGRRRGPRPERVVSVVDAAEGLPADALEYAERLAAEGRFREALRALFGGAARTLAHLGLVAQTRTRTNGELLAELAPEVASALRPLSDGFEVAWYGHVDPGRPGYARAQSQYAEVLAVAESTAGGRARP